MDIHINLDDVFKWIGYITCGTICLSPVLYTVTALWLLTDPVGTWRYNRQQRKRNKGQSG